MNLYPHQQAAVEWLRGQDRAGFFDDQGLGKTISALVALGDDPAVVVCPTVVLGNWKREAEQWLDLDDDRVQLLHTGSKRVRGKPRVVVTTHGMLLQKKVVGELIRFGARTLILDESHFLRSRDAKKARTFYGLLKPMSERVWALSGTPMPNWPTDLWFMCSQLWPDRFAESFEDFRARYCSLAPSDYGDGWRAVGSKNLIELRQRLQGITLRRKKTDVLDLPPLRFEQVYLETPWPDELRELEQHLDLDEIKALMDDNETADEAMRELLDMIDLARFRRITGEAKVRPAVELLRMELENDASVKRVVFCHHVEVAKQMHKALGGVLITGSTPAKKRTDYVESFQTDPRCRVAVCQIVAGGTGTTLTAADDVTFVEQSFSPGELSQACDRIYRIGQTKPCRVRFLSLRGSVDELTTRVLRRKTAAIQGVLG